MKDEQLLNAFTVWQDLSQSPEEFFAYQSRLKYILDEEAKLEDVKHMAEQEGMQKGIEQGIEQGEKRKQREIALKMLKKHTDVEIIAELTELTLLEISQLKESLE